jgi:NADH-quinone oxidoreductase subunit G
LAKLAAAIAEIKGVAPPISCDTSDHWRGVASSLIAGEEKAILLGNAAAHHQRASSLLVLANWVGLQVGATVGFLGEAANTVGAQLVGAVSNGSGKSSRQMVETADLKAVILMNVEPRHDVKGGRLAEQSISKADLVVTLSPFKTNLEISDVLLPIAPFTETSGSYVNAEARLQSFHAVVKPLGEARPAWKVLRALGSMLGVAGMTQETSQEVLAQALPGVNSGECLTSERLDNSCQGEVDLEEATEMPCTATIYQLDGLVRRSPSLQSTADARGVRTVEGVGA